MWAGEKLFWCVTNATNETIQKEDSSNVQSQIEILTVLTDSNDWIDQNLNATKPLIVQSLIDIFQN